MNLKELYEINADFRAYIDEFCRTGEYTVEQALTLKVVENVAKYYAAQGDNKTK